MHLNVQHGILVCPTCGMKVILNPDGSCPSCRQAIAQTGTRARRTGRPPIQEANENTERQKNDYQENASGDPLPEECPTPGLDQYRLAMKVIRKQRFVPLLASSLPSILLHGIFSFLGVLRYQSGDLVASGISFLIALGMPAILIIFSVQLTKTILRDSIANQLNTLPGFDLFYHLSRSADLGRSVQDDPFPRGHLDHLQSQLLNRISHNNNIEEKRDE